VVILCGGLATRLGDVTSKNPKCMISIAGQPFIFHQIHQLLRQNISEIFLCLGHLGDKVEQYLQTKSYPGLDIHYIYDGEQLLGTGGCIKNAITYLPEEFFILYGDSYLDINYAEVYNTYLFSEKSALLTIYKNQGLWDSSNVEMENNKIKLYSKKNINNNMAYIDYGLSIISPKVFDKINLDIPFDLSVIYEYLSKRKMLASFEAKNRFYEIGSKKGIVELDNYLNNKI